MLVVPVAGPVVAHPLPCSLLVPARLAGGQALGSMQRPLMLAGPREHEGSRGDAGSAPVYAAARDVWGEVCPWGSPTAAAMGTFVF